MACVSWLLVLLLAPAVFSAKTYIWQGGDTLFTNPLNWMNGFVPNNPNSIPCSTQFGGGPQTNIWSQLDASTVYYVGSTLYLPLNGVLRLATEGTVIAFSDASSVSNTCQQAVWSGGLMMNEQRNDFMCHLNWYDSDAGPSVPVSNPPCQGFTAQFDPTKTYSVYVSNKSSLVTVDQIIAPNGVTLSTGQTAASFMPLLPEIDLVHTTATVVIGSNMKSATGATVSVYTGACAPTFDFIPGTTTCVCYTSCPTPAMALLEETQRSQNLAAATQKTLQQQQVLNTFYFSGSYNAVSLGVTSNQLQNNANNATQLALLTQIAMAAVQSQLPTNGTAPSITISYQASPEFLVVSGSLVAQAQYLYPPGSITVPANSQPSPFRFSQTTATSFANATKLQNVIQMALAPKLLQYAAAQLQAQLDANKANLPSDSADLANTISNLPNPATVLNTANGDTCFAACTSTASCQLCVTSLETTLQNSGLSPENATNLANALANAKGQAVDNGQDWTTVANNINTVAQQEQQSNAISKSVDNATPKPYQFTSPTFNVGTQTTQNQQLRAVTSPNNATLAQALMQGLMSANVFVNVSNLNFNWVQGYSAPTNPSSGSRRRRSTTSAVVVTFQYTVMCIPNSPTCQLLTNSASYPAILAKLDTTFQNFASNLTAPACQTFSNGGSVGTIDYSCMNLLASAVCQVYVANGLGTTDARVATNATLYSLIQCNGFPPFPNGQCQDPSFQSFAAMNASMMSTAATCTPSTAASTGGGGGGLGMAAGAAGAGVAILIVIIVIIVLRRRKQRGNQSSNYKKSEDRTVVAFENPMYDDPGMAGSAQPVYDNKAGHDSEGLYDEPAFNATNKHNPVYQSNDDLTAGDGVKSGDGYLDVSPGAQPAEDVGYLEGKELPQEPAAGESEYAAAE